MMANAERMSRWGWLILWVGICSQLWTACGEKALPTQRQFQMDYNDAVIQHIINLRGKGQIDVLRTYLAVENPAHRYAAAWVLASEQDTAAIPDLAKTLEDEYPEIRSMAAFALGQTRSTTAAQVLADAFRQDTVQTVQAAILDAIGRCGTDEYLKHVASARPYPLKDTILLEGQALAVYRYATRGLIHPEATTKIMNDFVSNARAPQTVRFLSANYLAKAPNIDVASYEDVLLNAVRAEKDPNTLMFLVIGLAKTKTPQAWFMLRDLYAATPDYRVKCNIIRGVRYFPYDSTKLFVYNALFDSTNAHIPVVAAEYFYAMGRDMDALQYVSWTTETMAWQPRIMLHAAALKNLAIYRTPNKSYISQKLINEYQNSTNVYEKAAIIRALSNFEWNYRFIAKELLPTSDTVRPNPIILSTCAEALATIRSSDNFDRAMGLGRQRAIDELNAIFRQAIEQGDAGVIANLGDMLTNPNLGFQQAYPDWQFITEAQKKLVLPRDVETWLVLQRVINFFSGKPDENPTYTGKANLVEIDWQMVMEIKENPVAVINTSKGSIAIRLLVEEAPATITQFVRLAKGGYYNNKTFHRVVPNFVVQGGCSRGDGFGGFEATIPSELGLQRYWQAGCVGMASAGKNTESTQFFITHAPTIHLDGNYTMFAKVSEGMSVVHQLQIGDTIRTITIQ